MIRLGERTVPSLLFSYVLYDLSVSVCGHIFIRKRVEDQHRMLANLLESVLGVSLHCCDLNESLGCSAVFWGEI